MPLIGIPRIPLVPDPLRRARIPSDLESVTEIGPEDDPAAGGMNPDAVRRIWGAVRRLYRSGAHPAVQLCVRREGAVVVNRAIGHARGNGPGEPRDAVAEPVSVDTPFVIFSAAKAVTAMVAHLLDQQGKIHIADRVCEYIPEYARHGKDRITIEHVLSHRAGVPNLPGDVLKLENIGDRDLLTEMLIDAKPASRAGKTLAYHAVSGGFIIGELVQRVTGRDIREVLREHVLEPLDFRWMDYGVREKDVPLVGRSYATGAPPPPPLSTLLERALGAAGDEIVASANDPRFLTAVVPAANTVTTAFEMSRFFELLRRGGELDGVRVFEPRTIRRALTERSYREIDFTLGFPTRYGLGFMLGARLLSIFGPDTELAFGHLGYTNIIGWADPERALAGALITSGKPILYPELPLLWAVMQRIGAEAPKVADMGPVQAATEE